MECRVWNSEMDTLTVGASNNKNKSTVGTRPLIMVKFSTHMMYDGQKNRYTKNSEYLILAYDEKAQ